MILRFVIPKNNSIFLLRVDVWCGGKIKEGRRLLNIKKIHFISKVDFVKLNFIITINC